VGFRRRRWRDVAPEKDKVRVNRAIRVPEVRVVNEDGQQLGVMPTDAARDIAARIGLDLVEISPNGQPPVCKIMDYGRYKYELKKKAAVSKSKAHAAILKEVKLRPRTDDHDLDFKLKNARRFLIEGDKVKVTLMFRGREIVHTELGRVQMDKVKDLLADIAAVENPPRMEGRFLSMILVPNREAIARLERQRAAEAAKQTASEPDSDDSSADEKTAGEEPVAGES
jgi:translation initiation factor IF-3